MYVLWDLLRPGHTHPHLVFGVTGHEVTVNKAPTVFNRGKSKSCNPVLLTIALF